MTYKECYLVALEQGVSASTIRTRRWRGWTDEQIIRGYRKELQKRERGVPNYCPKFEVKRKITNGREMLELLFCEVVIAIIDRGVRQPPTEGDALFSSLVLKNLIDKNNWKTPVNRTVPRRLKRRCNGPPMNHLTPSKQITL